MKRERTVVFAESAVRDLEDILRFIETDSPGVAEQVIAELESAAKKLGRLSRMGRVVPELDRLGVTAYRELIVSRWRVVYRPGRTQVAVLAVIDASRDLELALLNRMLRG